MAQKGFLSDVLRRVAGSTRIGSPTREAESADLVTLGQSLLNDRSEASGLVTATRILENYAALPKDEKIAFFQSVCDTFGVDDEALTATINA